MSNIAPRIKREYSTEKGRKIAAKKIGVKRSAKARAILKKSWTPERRQIARERSLAYWENPDNREKFCERMKAHCNDPERRRVHLEAMGKFSPEKILAPWLHTPSVVQKMKEAKTGRPMKAPLLKKGPGHHQSKDWSFRDPAGKTHQFRNLCHFVREHSYLFDSEDMVWRYRGKSCRAIQGLRDAAKRGGIWKGWVSLKEPTCTYKSRGTHKKKPASDPSN